MKHTVFCLLVLGVAVTVASCAPSAGRQAVRYQAAPEDLVNAIADIGPNTRPGSAYNYFSINSIGEGHITLQADTTSGVSFFFGGGTVTLNFTAVASGGVSTLAVDTSGDAGAADDSIDEIISQLDARFDRTQSPVGMLDGPEFASSHL